MPSVHVSSPLLYLQDKASHNFIINNSGGQGRHLQKPVMRFSWANRKLIIHNDPSLCFHTELR